MPKGDINHYRGWINTDEIDVSYELGKDLLKPTHIIWQDMILNGLTVAQNNFLYTQKKRENHKFFNVFGGTDNSYMPDFYLTHTYNNGLESSLQMKDYKFYWIPDFSIYFERPIAKKDDIFAKNLSVAIRFGGQVKGISSLDTPNYHDDPFVKKTRDLFMKSSSWRHKRTGNRRTMPLNMTIRNGWESLRQDRIGTPDFISANYPQEWLFNISRDECTRNPEAQNELFQRSINFILTGEPLSELQLGDLPTSLPQ